MALDRGAERLRPAEQVGASGVAAFAGQRAGDVGGGVGVRDQHREPLGDTDRRHRHRFERGGEPVERLVELLPGHGLRAPVLGERPQRLAGERERVRDPGEPLRFQHRTLDPLATGPVERDQMTREIAAVHRGDVLRVERPQVLRVVPVVEVAAEALEAAHRLERRLETLDGVERAEPAEVAGGDRGEQVEAEVRRRRAVRHHRAGIFLEVVRREHVVRGRDEGLEEAPGAARDAAQRAHVRGAERRAAPDRRRAARPARDGGGRAARRSGREQRPPRSASRAARPRIATATASTTPPPMRR